jgi:hypothetical protein
MEMARDALCLRRAIEATGPGLVQEASASHQGFWKRGGSPASLSGRAVSRGKL